MAGPENNQDIADEISRLTDEVIILRESLDEFKDDSINILRSLARHFMANEPAQQTSHEQEYLDDVPEPFKKRKTARMSPYFSNQLSHDYHALRTQYDELKKIMAGKENPPRSE